MGLSEFVADIAAFDMPWLISRFERIQDNAEAVRRQIEARKADYRSALDSQYSLLFGETINAEPRLAPQTA
jgi:hypothetical protein